MMVDQGGGVGGERTLRSMTPRPRGRAEFQISAADDDEDGGEDADDEDERTFKNAAAGAVQWNRDPAGYKWPRKKMLPPKTKKGQWSQRDSALSPPKRRSMAATKRRGPKRTVSVAKCNLDT